MQMDSVKPAKKNFKLAQNTSAFATTRMSLLSTTHTDFLIA